ncbi:MAG: tRNA (adenosine(37)-N6)-threonylcarbamoyltransferase complex ATPase subunit type 1 TsaE [Alphaproteobacteria bacterium]|nr:tRNA (adenosine(37)-N6)-threonylcarbamoyltransferase complex ATPase subunit type 1 TsaE [Alphaproteobacteria bacterium]
MDDFMESDFQGATVLAKLRVAGESELGNLANCLATLCGSGDVLCLFGDLGAGKTSFARAFIRALTTPNQEVPSPTFTLVQVYETAKSPDSLAIWHADLFRLSDSQEIFELGLDDAFADALVLIEWPQRALEFLPLKRLEIHLSFCDKSTERSVVLRGDARWAGRLHGLLTMRVS